MSENYHQLRNELMHSNGTTPFETISVIFPTFLYVTFTITVLSLIQCYHTVSRLLQVSLEFVTLVIPIILNVTVLSEYTIQIAAAFFTMIVSTLTVVGPKSHKLCTFEKSTNFLTNARSTISIISVIAILAVDFRIFPRRFAKTENFGYSLMDVGVGLFVYSNGIVDSQRPDLLKALKSSLPLVMLGTVRFLVTNQINYHVPASEYGLHWNFFITLAFTKIFASLVMSSVGIRFLWINALLLICSHEVLLQMGLKNYVLADIKRDNFFSANREGLSSCMGYVSIYLFSAYCGYFLNVRSGTHKIKTCFKFAALSIIALIVTLSLEHYFGISRKLANAAYCSWILFIGLFMTGLYCWGEIVQKWAFQGKLDQCVYAPLIFEAVNYNGLPFFLLSNLLTGAVNMACDSLKIDDMCGLVIIVFYMVANCGLVLFLYDRRIKLKL